jgi:NHL repeat-containing protein
VPDLRCRRRALRDRSANRNPAKLLDREWGQFRSAHADPADSRNLQDFHKSHENGCRNDHGSFFTISVTGVRSVVPAANLISVNPARATQGESLTVSLQGQNTHWVHGQTRASFGPEVSVNGAPAGELGNITVTSFTTATAQITVSPTAALSPRTVRVVTPNVPAPFPLNFIEETASLADAFTVVATSPPGPSSTTVTTIAGLAGNPGFADGPASQARFQNPAGVATAADDSIYIADAGNNRIRHLRLQLDLSGNPQWMVSTLAGNGTYGFADGPAATAQFKNPQGVAVDGAGVVYVADTANHRIRKIALDGTVSTIAGDGTDGTAGQMVHLKIDNNNSWLNLVTIIKPDGFVLNRRLADAAASKRAE